MVSVMRKVIYALCISLALLMLVGAWLCAHPPFVSQSMKSKHPVSTMSPLMGFSADGLINVGNAKDFDLLPGIGVVISQRMVEMREALGGFRLPEDLLLVKGIGEKKLKDMMDYLTEPFVKLPEIVDEQCAN